MAGKNGNDSGSADKATDVAGGGMPSEAPFGYKADGTPRKRAAFTRNSKPSELAVVVRATDENGAAMEGVNIEILTATKDISEAFRTYKNAGHGADMVTFTMGKGNQVDAQKEAA